MGRVFNAVERLGYLLTSLRASQNITDDASEFNNGISWLIADVLCNQTKSLIEYSADYPAVTAYLNDQKTAITKLFEIAKSADFNNYGDSREDKLTNFASADNLWQMFINKKWYHWHIVYLVVVYKLQVAILIDN